MKRARTFVCLGAALWCAAIVLAPVFDLRPIYDFFSRICHQDPTRSWSLAGAQFPVCVRCASIYFGFFIASAFLTRPNYRFLQFAAAATIVEFIIARVILDSPWLRSATGLAL